MTEFASISLINPRYSQKKNGKNDRFEHLMQCIQSGGDLSEFGAYQVFELLDKLDGIGRSPLYLAIESNRLEFVERLLKMFPTQINTETKGRKTPLLLAVERNYIDIVKLLLEEKADIECRNFVLRTPLHVAAEHNHLEMVKLLLDEGANSNAVDKFGDKPVDLTDSHEIYCILYECTNCTPLEEEDNVSDNYDATSEHEVRSSIATIHLMESKSPSSSPPTLATKRAFSPLPSTSTSKPDEPRAKIPKMKIPPLKPKPSAGQSLLRFNQPIPRRIEKPVEKNDLDVQQEQPKQKNTKENIHKKLMDKLAQRAELDVEIRLLQEILMESNL